MPVSITVNDRQLRALSRALSERTQKRAQIEGLNEAGKKLRTMLPAALAELVGAPKSAFKVKSRAASLRRSGNPTYVVGFDRAIAINKLKASARRFERRTKRGGTTRQGFSLRQPDGSISRFKAVFKDGQGRSAKFSLHRAGSLPERKLGGVTIRANAFSEDGGYPSLATLRRKTGKDLQDAMVAAIQKAVNRRSRR